MQKKYIVRLSETGTRQLAGSCQEAEGQRSEGAACPDSAESRCGWPRLDR